MTHPTELDHLQQRTTRTQHEGFSFVSDLVYVSGHILLKDSDETKTTVAEPEPVCGGQGAGDGQARCPWFSMLVTLSGSASSLFLPQQVNKNVSLKPSCCGSFSTCRMPHFHSYCWLSWFKGSQQPSSHKSSHLLSITAVFLRGDG